MRSLLQPRGRLNTRGAALANLEDAALEKYVDWPDLMARVDNDRALLAELFAVFQEEFPRLRDALRDAAREGVAPGAQKAAHKLKGMLANLSISLGAELAAVAEAAARAGDMAKVRLAVAALDGETEGLPAALGSGVADGWQ